MMFGNIKDDVREELEQMAYKVNFFKKFGRPCCSSMSFGDLIKFHFTLVILFQQFQGQNINPT